MYLCVCTLYIHITCDLHMQRWIVQSQRHSRNCWTCVSPNVYTAHDNAYFIFCLLVGPKHTHDHTRDTLRSCSFLVFNYSACGHLYVVWVWVICQSCLNWLLSLASISIDLSIFGSPRGTSNEMPERSPARTHTWYRIWRTHATMLLTATYNNRRVDGRQNI